MKFINKICYKEFLLVVFEYFQTLNLKLFIFEVGLPFLFSATIILYNRFEPSFHIGVESFIGVILNIVGVLLGFSIALLTILATADSSRTNELRTYKTEQEIWSKKISLFELLLLGFTYTIFLEIVVVLVSISYPFIFNNFKFPRLFLDFGFGIYMTTVFHIFFILIRNIIEIYNIFTKPLDSMENE